MKRKLTAEKMLEKFQKNVRNMSQEELLDVVGYSFMRVVELEMLFQVLLEKKVISPTDFEKIIPKLEKKVMNKFKVLETRKKFIM